jgi:NAD kinase
VFSPKRQLVIERPRGGGLALVDGGPSWRLRAGDRVKARAHEHRLRMVRFTPAERFYELLRQKLGWGLPLVPTPSRRA